MAGSHRAPAPERRSRFSPWALALTLVVLLVPLALFLHNRSGDDDPSTPSSTSTPDTSIQTTPTHVPTAPTPTLPQATLTPRATRAAEPLPRVKPDVPRRLIVAGLIDIGFDDAIAPHNGVFQAASTAEAARWAGRGLPGSPSTDTVFLIGKVSNSGAFEKLPNLKRGSRITLRTDSGVLTYTVQAIATKASAGLTKDAAFVGRHVGRLQLVGIRYTAAGDRTGATLVVTAQLTGARRT